MTRGGRIKTHDTPLRRCIASGESAQKPGLIRFVLGPDGQEVVPDLAERLPGRGTWLTADRAMVDKAVAKRLFARAFRAPARAAPDLADRIERLLAARLIDRIALARKAGHAVTGFEKTRARLAGGTAGALLTASDAGADGARKLARLAPETARIALLDSAELGLAFGRDFAIHAALDREGGFADRAVAEARRLAGFRGTKAAFIGDGTAAMACAGDPRDDDEIGPGTGPEQDDG